MIKVYPIEIEAVDENNGAVFKFKTCDEHCAEIKMDRLLSNTDLEELFDAIRKGMKMLELTEAES